MEIMGSQKQEAQPHRKSGKLKIEREWVKTNKIVWM